MAEYISKDMETSIIKLVNELSYDTEFFIDKDYKRIDFRLWNNTMIEKILKKLKFKDIGNIFKYPDDLPQPASLIGYDVIDNFDRYQRINVSEKYNCILVYSLVKYSSPLTFITTTDNVKKVLKRIKPILDNDEQIDVFKSIDFNCKKNEYIDITYKMDRHGEEDNCIQAIKRKVQKETLVFDKSSELFKVMNDIYTFFKNETKELYKKMDIVYKRGIIIHGDPGNGKSAMIREMIRQLSDINKIVVSSDAVNITKVLSALITKLNKQKSIIIIEDIDSMITDRNRSEFLNLLDGVNVKSGIYFIGTTNYPEKIDPAFINRSGRFDRTYKIDNPDTTLREFYFKSKNISNLLSSFKVHKDNSENRDLGIVGIFVKYSEGLSMANLKEFMLTSQYTLVTGGADSIEEAAMMTKDILNKPVPVNQNHRNRFMEYLPQ